MSDPAPTPDAAPSPPVQKRRGPLRLLGSLLYWLLAWLLCAYVAAAAWAWMPGPPWLAVLAGAAVFAPAWIWGFVRTAGWRAWLGRGFIVLVLVVLSAVEPQRMAQWSSDQAYTVTADTHHDVMSLRNVRRCEYFSPDDYDISWDTWPIDPTRIDQVWYVVEPFSPGSPAAHTFLSFGIADGKGGHRYLAVSVEIRRESGESFSPLAALFRRFELIYVFADERDVIGLRAIHRQHDVFLYPVKATPEQAQALFMDMLERAVALERQPEFYHTVTNNCTSNIAMHLRHLWPGSVPAWDLRYLLPAGADELALERGLLDCVGPIDDLRKRYNISQVARQSGDKVDNFSDRIRAGLVRVSASGR